MAGNDVVVISNNYHLVDIRNRPDLIKEIKARGNEYWYDGIKVYKIETILNISSNSSFFCLGLRAILEKEKPDMVFHHNVGLATLTVAAKYKRRHPNIKLYVDNHADWINESKNRLWHLIYYHMLAPFQIKCVGKAVDYFIGVSPLRCQYLEKVYKVPHDKVRLLPIGCDTEQARHVNNSREELRKKFSIPGDAIVVVSGGKIDRTKGTLNLIAACNELRQIGDNICLVLFGKIDEEVSIAAKHDWIKCFGWCDRNNTLSLLKLADVACWPLLHTTLIEDSVTVGTPLVVKLSDNVIHFAKENAGVFLNSGDKKELVFAIAEVINNTKYYRQNVMNACNKYSYATLVNRLENELFCEL
jgi:glycosyltransferase involved in cell wall biosynthesis